MLTLSIIKADTGGFVGHSAVHPDLLARARQAVTDAVASGLLVDGTVATCGDDVSLIMTHRHGADDPRIHRLAWDTFAATTEIARGLGLYGAGQDLLSDAFSGKAGDGSGLCGTGVDRAAE
jgi:fructose 1,6-bisphosphate aldolase/phosphatase